MTVTIGSYVFNHMDYDERGDVLYLHIGEPQEASDSILTPEGHVIRYDEASEVVGITLINAKWLLERDGRLTISFPVFTEELLSAQQLEPALS
jgi:uncharacterized protein YuzE